MSNYNNYQPERKISAGDGPKNKPGAGAASMHEKSGHYCGLPGKAQPRNRSLGVKKVNIYAHSEGL